MRPMFKTAAVRISEPRRGQAPPPWPALPASSAGVELEPARRSVWAWLHGDSAAANPVAAEVELESIESESLRIGAAYRGGPRQLAR